MVEVFCRDPGDKEGVRLDGFGVGGANEVLLALENEVPHFVFYVVKYPTFE